MRLSEVLPKFLAWNQAGKACKKDYVHIVNRFIRDIGDLEVEEVEGRICEFFEKFMHLDPTTFNNYRARLRAFFEFCKKHRHLRENPIDLIAARKHRTEEGWLQDEHQVKVMPIEMVKFILARIKRNEATRHYYAILLCAETGARPIEVCRLKKDNLQDNCIHFKLTKTGNPRYVFINENLASEIAEWSQLDGGNYLVSDSQGNMLTTNALSRIWARNAASCVIPETGDRPNLYALRHTKATSLIESLPLARAAKILGMSINTMNRYHDLTQNTSREVWESTKHLSYVS